MPKSPHNNRSFYADTFPKFITLEKCQTNRSKIMRVFTLFLCLVSFSICAQTDKPAFSNMDVFQLEYAMDPRISPDGKQVVYVRRSMDIMEDRKTGRIWILNSDGKDHRKLTSRDVNESTPRWSPDGSRIAFISSTDEGSEIFVYWIKSGQFARLTQLNRSPSGLSWSPDGKQLAFSMLVPEDPPVLVSSPEAPEGAKWSEKARVTTRARYQADGRGYLETGYSHLFVLPAEGGTPKQLTRGEFHHNGTPHWADNGNSLVFSSNRNENWEYEIRNSEIYKLDINSEEITALTDRNGPDSDLAVSADGKRIAYTGYDDKVQAYQSRKLYIMNSDGSGKKEVKVDLDRSIESPVWDVTGKAIYFKYDDKGNTRIGVVSPDGVKIKKGITTLNFGAGIKIADNLGGTSIGRPYGGGSFSTSKSGKIVYTYASPEHPADVAVLSGTSPVIITRLNSDLLDHRTLGKVEEVWYKSTVDQRDVQGWIVKPPFFDASKKYPLLVENHGGPISNYGDRFSPEIQLYASAGYVVFYPNPRGSTSYGEEFANLLYNNYPGEDYNDVMDGVDAVLAKGYVDEDSLFVTGGSAGGIMSAWIIGKNNRFRAAAVVKPVMNWVSKLLTADNYMYYAEYRYPGQVWENFENYLKFSPISLVGNIKTPTLVMVGTSDLRTPLSEAVQLYHALKLRKIETALVEIPGSYHNIANRPSQLIMKTDHVLAWFEKYRK